MNWSEKLDEVQNDLSCIEKEIEPDHIDVSTHQDVIEVELFYYHNTEE